MNEDNYPLFVLDWDYETFCVLDTKGDVIQLYDIYEHYIRGYCKEEHPEYIWLMGYLWCGSGELKRTLYKRAKGKRDIYKRLTPRAPDSPSAVGSGQESEDTASG